jgi:hypothetical protein
LDRFLETKAKVDAGTFANQEDEENTCVDAFHALSSVRALLASGLQSGALLSLCAILEKIHGRKSNMPQDGGADHTQPLHALLAIMQRFSGLSRVHADAQWKIHQVSLQACATTPRMTAWQCGSAGGLQRSAARTTPSC